MTTRSQRAIREALRTEIDRYHNLKRKFKQACNQVVLLNNVVQDNNVRYLRAVQHRNRAFRYVGRLKLATVEGVRDMIYEYAARTADELDTIQERFIRLGIMDEISTHTYSVER